MDAALRLLRGLVVENSDSIDVQGALGTMLARRGDVAEATRITDWLAALDRHWLLGTNTYWRARITSVSGDREKAVRLLDRAYREGMEIWKLMHTEPDFLPLRGDSAFEPFMRPRGRAAAGYAGSPAS